MPHLKIMPTPGIDYPTNWSQYLDWFHSEELCRNYLEKLRWPTGFICPKCQQSDTTIKSSRARFICSSCKYQATVTARTIFNKTRTELRIWFAAIWYITNQKHGVSALGLQRVLGLNSYETAWTMLHRLRRAMVLADRSLLSGLVEVDETYLALTDRLQPISSKGRKSNTSKILVAIAVEVHSPKGFGRVRIRRIDNGDSERLIPFVQDNVLPRSTVHTDGSAAYNKLESVGYKHEVTVHLGSDIPAHKSMPAIHRVASLLQRWLLGTHHGSVQPHQLDYYLDEYVFRFNRRSSKSRGLLFYRLLQQAVVTEPVTYNDIIS